MAYTPNEPLVDIGDGDNIIGRVMLTDSILVATLRDLLGAKALDVAIVDGSGDQITSFGGGTQYLEGTVTSSIVGNAILWEDTGETLQPVSAAKPLPISGAVTVSGTVTADQGSPAAGADAWPVLFTSSTDALVKAGDPTNNALRINVVVALPTGDNTVGRVKLTDGTTVATVRELGTNDALNVAIVDGSGDQITSFGGGTQYLEGTVTSSIIGTAIMWEEETDTLRPVSATKPLPVNVVAGGGGGSSDTAARTSVPGSVSVVTLLSSNANRLGATIFNDSTARLHLAFGSSASLTDFTCRLDPLEYFELPIVYTGIITGIWSDSVGSARVTELT